jgi:hypothetical protein
MPIADSVAKSALSHKISDTLLFRHALRFGLKIFGWRLFEVLHRLRKTLRFGREQ